MKILVTGANGFLGQHLCHYFSSKGLNISGVSRGKSRIPEDIQLNYFEADLCNSQQVKAIVGHIQPDVIIHTAAMSKPDECQADKEACLRCNVEATRFLLAALKENAASAPRFIYISTDFIFGENGPHGEDEKTGPLNFYGESKLMAEQLVKQSGLNYNIVRPVFIYGTVWNGLRPSFLHWVKNNLEQNKPIKVVSDQQRTPTFVNDICAGIEQLMIKKQNGDYHLAGKDILSPYQMAVTTARVLGLDESLIENVNSETFPEPVRRAKKSGLKIDKAIRDLGYRPVSFEEGVQLSFNVS